jgi:hypothetical protein
MEIITIHEPVWFDAHSHWFAKGGRVRKEFFISGLCKKQLNMFWQKLKRNKKKRKFNFKTVGIG